MLSFVPKMDMSTNVNEPAVPFRSFVHRCYVPVTEQVRTAGDLLRTAKAVLMDHFVKRAAYYGTDVPEFEFAGIWAKGPGGTRLGVAVPLTGADFLLSDAVVADSGRSAFVESPPADGLSFARLPSDLSVELLRSLSHEERRRVLLSSPNMRRTWGDRVALDLPCDEVFFEVDIFNSET